MIRKNSADQFEKSVLKMKGRNIFRSLNPDGTINLDPIVALNNWHNYVENLLNFGEHTSDDNICNTIIESNITHDIFLDCNITIDEVRNAVLKLKSGKALGSDAIPAGILKMILLLIFK